MHLKCPDAIRPLVDYCVEKELGPVILNKEEYLVIMPDSRFSEKALTAVKKNFGMPTTLKSLVVRLHALDLSLRRNLESIACNVKKAN